jgi:hypothetical protein
MVSNTALFVAFPIGIAIFGVFAKFGFDMKRDEKPKQMWAWFCCSVIPIAVIAIIWSSQNGITMGTRNAVLGVVGAALGASLMIWLGYIFQSPNAPIAGEQPITPPTNSIGVVRNNSGIVTQGQHGSNHQ